MKKLHQLKKNKRYPQLHQKLQQNVETVKVETSSTTDTSAVDLLSGVFGGATPTETVEVEVPKADETPKSTPSADTNPFAGFDTASWEQGFKLD